MFSIEMDLCMLFRWNKGIEKHWLSLKTNFYLLVCDGVSLSVGSWTYSVSSPIDAEPRDELHWNLRAQWQFATYLYIAGYWAYLQKIY